MKEQTGFTLVELLITIALISVILTVTVTIIIAALRTATKTDITTLIRQNGNYVTEQVSDTLRYASEFDGVKVHASDSWTTDCSGSSSLQYNYLSIKTQTGAPLVYYCGSDVTAPTPTPTPDPNGYNTYPIASNGAQLIDDSNIIVNSCYFTCTQTSSVDSPVVGINFTLSHRTASSFAENQVSQTFNSNTVMRNVHY